MESDYERGQRLEMIEEEATTKIRIEKEKQVIAGLLNKTLSGTVGQGRHAQGHRDARSGAAISEEGASQLPPRNCEIHKS